MRTKIKNLKQKMSTDHVFRKRVLATSAVVVLLGAFFVWNSFNYVSTDNAFVEGHIIAISPKVSSHVSKVLVNDNQRVKKGDGLVELDPNDFEVRHQIAKADREAVQADAEQAKRDLERYTNLSKNNEVSKQQLDQAELKARTANARVSAAAAHLRQAELDLSYTKILAPVTGYVTKKSVEEGAFVQIGQPLLAIVPDEMWVIANFKETQLKHMRLGQKVKIKIDAYSGREFKGHVDSIQLGTGAKFSMFPPENAAGNFVKVVQRIPVKIVFDEEMNEKYRLRVGMSVVPKVKVR